MGSTCSGGSPLVLEQVDPLGLGSVDRGSTCPRIGGPGVHQPGGSTDAPTPEAKEDVVQTTPESPYITREDDIYALFI